MVEQLGHGHRVNHSHEVRDDLLQLIDRTWKKLPRPINGKFRHAQTNSPGCAPECKPKKRPHKSKPKKQV
jgi:hypothetical protein